MPQIKKAKKTVNIQSAELMSLEGKERPYELHMRHTLMEYQRSDYSNCQAE
jgi:hypothetical protein